MFSDMTQPAKTDELRQLTDEIRICAMSLMSLQVQIYNFFIFFAGAERVELPSAVLETAMLPLHHAPTSAEGVRFELTEPFPARRFSGLVP